MNLIATLQQLWSRRGLVALAVGVAAVVAVLAVYRVGIFPPSISERSQTEARGSIEILVDSARSPIADARRDLSGLTARAGVFARYIGGGDVIGRIAAANGIPAEEIDVAGPTPLPGEAPGSGEASPHYHPYGVSVEYSGELPILTVSTRAPSTEQALGLAAAVPPVLREVVGSIQAQQETPPDKQVEFRELGPAEAAVVDDAPGKKMALLVFAVVLAFAIALILAVPRLAALWRSTESTARDEEPAPPRGQAGRIAARLTPERIDEIVDEAPFADEEARERVRGDLRARVRDMSRQPNGQGELFSPARGAPDVDARLRQLDVEQLAELFPEAES